MIKRRASAVWEGDLKSGKGTMSSFSGVLNDTPYSFLSRLVSADGTAGTNPEELLAAAHAGCYGMATSATMGAEGFVPDFLKVSIVLTMAMEGAPTITAVDITVEGKVPNMTAEKFEEVCASAAKMCVISRALNPSITITKTATLVA
jgi:lipoyl-dependent peroxiredoxin